jgi:hypothetical protein
MTVVADRLATLREFVSVLADRSIKTERVRFSAAFKRIMGQIVACHRSLGLWDAPELTAGTPTLSGRALNALRRFEDRPLVEPENRKCFAKCVLALQAALDGLGLAYVGEFQAGPLVRSGDLVPVLEEWCPEFEGFHLYHPSHRHIPAALRALIDMAQAVRRERRSAGLSAARPSGDPRRPLGGETGRRGPRLVPGGEGGTSRTTDQSTQQIRPRAWSRAPAANR